MDTSRRDSQDKDHLPVPRDQIGIIIVDHGSRRAESNAMLEQIVEQFSAHSRFEIIEPAHMELAEPSIARAFERCVGCGAKFVIVHPYFLLPGRHWTEDIPRLASVAAAKHPDVDFRVTAPLGLHRLMLEVIEDRITECLREGE